MEWTDNRTENEKRLEATIAEQRDLIDNQERGLISLEATIAELKKDRDIALAESYRCGYEAALKEK